MKNAQELYGVGGGNVGLRAFENIPLYLLLKFLSRPATTPIEIFYEEVFPNPESDSNSREGGKYRRYRIGENRRFNRRSQLNQIDFDGDYWGMSSDMFSERKPVEYSNLSWRSRPSYVRNLIHESIQLKIGQLGEKRFPMNYFRRGINLES